MPTRRGNIGNPVARSPLLRKGGAHQRARSGERQRQRADLGTAMEQWREEETIDLDNEDRLDDQEDADSRRTSQCPARFGRL